MTIWAKENKVRFYIVQRISINVIDFEWRNSCDRIYFIPITSNTLSSILPVDVPTYMGRKVISMKTSQTGLDAVFPRRNIHAVFSVILTSARTVLFGRVFQRRSTKVTYFHRNTLLNES